MKKIILGLFVFLLSLEYCYAMDYNKLDLIPVSDSANVSGEIFDYKDIKYSLINDSYFVNFSSILNKSTNKVPVSINILLFDSNKVNIGFLAYCSTYDYDSDYSGINIGSNDSTALSIKVLPKYFVDGKSASDVAYISVLDDNSYCQVGDSDKYATLTIEDIRLGLQADDVNGKTLFYEFEAFFVKNFFRYFLLGILILGVIIFINGFILNILNKKMYGTTDINAYIPIANNYLKLKLAFNETFAYFGMGLYFIGCFILFFGNEIAPLLVALIIFDVASIRVIIKIFTYKNTSNNQNNNISVDTSNVEINNQEKKEEVIIHNNQTADSVKNEEVSTHINQMPSNSINNEESDLSKFFK